MMVRRTSVTVLFLAILAAAWVSESLAQAQDPAVAEAATLKHRKHGKQDKYDKEPKHDKYYEKHDGHDDYAEKPYHGEEYYSGEKPSYSGEYSTGEGYYSGSGEYTDPETPTPTDLPRHMDITVQLDTVEYAVCPACNDKKLNQTAIVPRHKKPHGHNRTIGGAAPGSKQSFDYYYKTNAFCHAEGPYGYGKHDEPATSVPVAEYIYDYIFPDTGLGTHTECYGQETYVNDYIQGYLTDITATAATSCDKDLKQYWKMETYGPETPILALMRLPDSILAGTASAQYGEYYDERTHAVCGEAWIFKGTATYGSDTIPDARLVTTSYTNFWDWVAAGSPTSVTDQYAYFGPVHYVTYFEGYTSNGDYVYIPSSGDPIHERAGKRELDTPSMLQIKCKKYRNSLPLLKFGIIEADLRRYTWDKTKTLRAATGVTNDYLNNNRK